MLTFIKRSTAILLLSLFTSLTAHTQTQIVETLDGDTMICYPVHQTKYFLKTIYRLNECEALYFNAKQQLRLKDSVSRYNGLMLKNYAEQIDNKDAEIKLANYQITALTESGKTKDKTIRRQKFYKWCIVIGASAIIGTEGYFLLKR